MTVFQLENFHVNQLPSRKGSTLLFDVRRHELTKCRKHSSHFFFFTVTLLHAVREKELHLIPGANLLESISETFVEVVDETVSKRLRLGVSLDAMKAEEHEGITVVLSIHLDRHIRFGSVVLT